jgi:lipopolysaccharide heptosyltransferase II
VTPTAAAWAHARSILCVRLDAAGDLLMTVPALRALRESRPGRRLTLLCSPSGAQAAALVPEIDDVIVYEAPWMKHADARADAGEERRIVAELTARRFDAAVVFTVFTQTPFPAAMLCWLADIPLRAAYVRERAYTLLTTELADPDAPHDSRHEVRRQLDLVAALGSAIRDEKIRLCVPDEARRRAAVALEGAGIDPDGPWFLVHPGATAPSRRWPADRFADAARRVARRTASRVVVTGTGAERLLVEETSARIGDAAAPIAGRLAFDAFAALVERAPLLLTNNTGPAHLAAAFDTPVVVLYALTNPQHAPWMARSRVLSHAVPCRNCFRSVCAEGHHACLLGIGADTVADAALELLATTRPAPRPAAQPAA